MTELGSPEVLALLREVLENQIAANDPPETAHTLARLQREGVRDDTAWRLLSAVLLQELNTTLGEQRPFDRARYIAALHRLPKFGIS